MALRARISLLAVLLVGCGATAKETSSAASTADAPELPDLGTPNPYVVPARMSEPLRRGWERTSEFLGEERPRAPQEPGLDAWRGWMRQRVQPWLEQRVEALEAISEQLRQAAEGRPREDAMAVALVGLLYERFAAQLRDLPAPRATAHDEQVSTVVETMFDEQAHPLLEHARRAYRSCAERASERGDAENWARWCARRADSVPRITPS